MTSGRARPTAARAAAEAQVDELLRVLRPTPRAEARRREAVDVVGAALRAHAALAGAALAPAGSYAVRTYLPDADVNLALASPRRDDGGAGRPAATTRQPHVVGDAQRLVRVDFRSHLN